MIDEKVAQLIGDLEEEDVLEIIEDFVASSPSEEDSKKVLAACQKGMAIVGDRFEKGEYFVGDLIFAGELLTESIDLLKPVLGSSQSERVGKIVLATVRGDLHDIGKNIFKTMAEAAGFQVIDLGIDQSEEMIVEKIRDENPDILGMSGILTLSLKSMKDTVEALKSAELRDSVKIIIGGNPVTKEASDDIGADAFTTNAAAGVKMCLDFLR
ncbi:cobalamin B12-binding domain-containing protein [Alkalibacter saccharofermentans]|uniref:Methylmalonyl-CoA mutase C-terminal domain-containing protein n=1 Tax=Alkalibacter saccharofermentans DSM 14828 TaxID=1120975 RepID=A0A1M4XZ59_9FIRM|nr:cobalamin-dependent protein [Alkalibacter saccharofermentans]SHE98725.1 methylmalonyl-CoA mutase C-terminal domain-containing protein [Alkalibacter saccharofermentans DSM 14828]